MEMFLSPRAGEYTVFNLPRGFFLKTSLGVTVQGSDFFQEHTTLNQFYCPIKLSKTDKVELLFKLKLPRKNPTGKFHDHIFGL